MITDLENKIKMLLEAAANLRVILLDEGIILGDEPLKSQNTGHGNCCTCSGCGRFYDDCACQHNRILAALEPFK